MLGKPLGHRKGINGTDLLSYLDARLQIYLPTYKWVLDNIPEVKSLVERIANKSRETDIVLLDYNTNDNYMNLSAPLSHAALIKLYIEGRYPDTVDFNSTNTLKGEIDNKQTSIQLSLFD
jgi:hypothetical protein